MAKQRGNKGPEEKARRKLARAQLALEVAQEQHAQAKTWAEQVMEKARVRADTRLSKANQRVARRAEAVSRAEARLLSLQTERHQKIILPAAVEDEHPVEVMTEPGGPIVSAPGEPPELREREQRALDALRQVFRPGGVPASEWRTAAGMADTTFLRARRALMDRGLVTLNGDDARGALYVLTDSTAPL